MVKRILVLLAMLCMASGVMAQTRPEFVVQLADARGADGNFSNWSDLAVFWYEEPVAKPCDPKVVTSRAVQKWVVPDLDTGLYWKFQFVRNVGGEYAIRVAFVVDGAQGLWSEIAIMYLMRPKGASPE